MRILDSVIAGSLRHRTAVAVVALAVAIAGALAIVRMPIDVLPDLDRPVVTVLTEAPGVGTEDVEKLVTWPIERALNGAAGVFRVRSTSTSGLSVVMVDFDWDTDIWRARQIVAEKLQLADVPRELRPELAPVSSIMGQVLLVGFHSQDGTTPLIELRRIVDRDVLRRVRAIPGVAQATTIGGPPTELQVVADARRLAALGVTLSDVHAAVVGANVAAAGGIVDAGVTGPLVELQGRIATPEELRSAVVAPDPRRPVLVEDVAEVRYGPAAVRVGDAGIDGHPGVLLVVTKQPGIDTVELSERVDLLLTELEAALPADIRIDRELFRQDAFIHRAIDNVVEAVRDGALLVVVVLFLFLLNVRTTLITLTAIPLSVAVTAVVFAAFDLTINTMTLGGLAVAIGTLVDDAIVDVENVWRRLTERRGDPAPRRTLDVVFEASREVRGPVTYGTLLVTVVYLPLFFLSGVEGRLFVPIGLAYVVSVAASLAVAMTVTPVLCLWLLGGAANGDRRYGGRLVRGLRRAAVAGARLGVRHPGAVTAGVLALVLCSTVVLLSRGTSFLPAFNEGTAQVNLFLPPDTGLATSSAFGERLERELLQVEGVAHVARRTGRAAGDEHAMPVSVTEAIVTFEEASDRPREAVIEDIRARVAEAFPGAATETETEQPLAHLLSHMLSGVAAQVAIKVSGPDLGTLREIAARIEAAVARVPGVRDLFVEPLLGVDRVEIVPRRDLMARHGIAMAAVAETVELAGGAAVVSTVTTGEVPWPITISVREADRAAPEQLGELRVRGAEGELVRIADVAELRIGKTPNEVRREDVTRRIVVRHNVAERSIGEVVADVERALEPIRADLARHPGYAIELAGQFEAQRDASRVIGWLSLVAAVLMVLLLTAHFRSVLLALLVLLSRGIALIGAVAAIVLTGQDVSVATLVGLIALFGMATRNGILLVDHAVELARVRGGRLRRATILAAARERVVPVCMTALTSGIALVPLALSPGEPGREILWPVATVILGGLVTNTLLDFLLAPALLVTFGHRAGETLARGTRPTTL